MTKRRLAKYSSYFATAAIFVAGISPGTFNIPSAFHPWVFILSILWIVAFLRSI